jgi:hypothetical protein
MGTLWENRREFRALLASHQPSSTPDEEEGEEEESQQQRSIHQQHLSNESGNFFKEGRNGESFCILAFIHPSIHTYICMKGGKQGERGGEFIHLYIHTYVWKEGSRERGEESLICIRAQLMV